MAMCQDNCGSLPTPAPPTNMIGFFRPTIRSKKNLSEEVSAVGTNKLDMGMPES